VTEVYEVTTGAEGPGRNQGPFNQAVKSQVQSKQKDTEEHRPTEVSVKAQFSYKVFTQY